ncbi:MAG: alpha-ketoglutarate-dependent dioxygenase AlkB family protein [Cyanobium sp.]
MHQPGLALRLQGGWLPAEARIGLRDHLSAEISWSQPLVRVHGRLHRVPRLVAWYGDPGCCYRYSGLRHDPQPWTPLLERLRDGLEEALGLRFNSLLLNRYRSGFDRMGWHADDEPELDHRHAIASLSLGASRDLRFRPRAPLPAPDQREGRIDAGDAAGPEAFNLALADGDLLLMDPPTQQHWQHALPVRRRERQERFNLTFRRIAASG